MNLPTIGRTRGQHRQTVIRSAGADTFQVTGNIEPYFATRYNARFEAERRANVSVGNL